MIDYHLHTSLCGHAVGAMDQFLAEAAVKGLTEVGFADHFPLGLLGYTPQFKVTMEPGELEGYIEAVREQASRHNGPAVKLGLEVDYLPESSRRLAKIFSRYPVDYLIGSVHFIDDWDFSHPRNAEYFRQKDLKDVYSRYFELVWEACQTGIFEIIGHVDIIKKFGFRLDDGELEPYWRRTARILKDNGICLELNTSGMAAPAGEFYPGRLLLEICHNEGVAVTLGSDAHAPQQVGRYFPEALALLREVGFHELAVFSGRRRSLVNF